jgi:hypothetical protein
MYDKLLEELGAIAKAMPGYEAQDGEEERIRRAAADGADMDGDDDEDDDDDKDGEGEEVFGKSFRVTMPDGGEAEVIDGTAVVAKLGASLKETQDGFSSVMRKSMKVMSEFNAAIAKRDAVIAKQGEMLKSLSETVERIGGEGRGRKAVVSVSEKRSGDFGDVNKADGITPAEFMAKSRAAFERGKITDDDLMRVEAHINRGISPPAEIIGRIAAAS